LALGIGRSRKRYWHVIVEKHIHFSSTQPTRVAVKSTLLRRDVMKIWNKPQVREQAVGMEVTAYLSADIDLI
jgi:coenzyme PQQ precursor peptide PqqA